MHVFTPVCLSHQFFSIVSGWKEGEEGSGGERKRSQRSRPDKWPPPGEWHGKHDVVRGGQVGQECHAGRQKSILEMVAAFPLFFCL